MLMDETKLKIEEVMKRVYEPNRLMSAWQHVKRNAGTAGIDEMTIDEFAKDGKRLMRVIYGNLRDGTYRFKSAKRVLIPKPGTKKKRKLGIPIVMDRIVSTSISMILEEIFDPSFSPSNFGFRKGRSQHSAIAYVKEIVNDGYEECVSIDLKSFFDEIPHGLIFKLLRREIKDELFITLIARHLKAGVIIDGIKVKTDKGCPQGAPASPIISNIVLNELDQELEKRGHRFCRWADDFIILVKSERSAARVMDSTIKYLEQSLELPVNNEKSKTGNIRKINFLSFSFLIGKVRISTEAKKIFREKVKRLTKRNNPLSMYQIIKELNQFLRGWVNYFKIQEFKSPLEELDWYVRSRLRSMQLKKWKNPRKFQHEMRKAGFGICESKRVWVKMNKWQSVHRAEVKWTLNLDWFRGYGLITLKDYNLVKS
jgi:RNA-directed DNA polymerase